MAINTKFGYKRCILLIVAFILLAGAAFGSYRLATYESANHADRLSKATLESYNSTVSSKAATAGYIQFREIVLLESITKTYGQDPVLVFRIYRLPEGTAAEDFMKARAGEGYSLIEMGTLTCRIVGTDPATAYDIRTSYTK